MSGPAYRCRHCSTSTAFADAGLLSLTGSAPLAAPDCATCAGAPVTPFQVALRLMAPLVPRQSPSERPQASPWTRPPWIPRYCKRPRPKVDLKEAARKREAYLERVREGRTRSNGRIAPERTSTGVSRKQEAPAVCPDEQGFETVGRPPGARGCNSLRRSFIFASATGCRSSSLYTRPRRPRERPPRSTTTAPNGRRGHFGNAGGRRVTGVGARATPCRRSSSIKRSCWSPDALALSRDGFWHSFGSRSDRPAPPPRGIARCGDHHGR